MDTTTLPRTTTATDAAADAEGRCQMCEHRAADHDALSTRYCAATATGTLTRGCICP